MLFGGMQKLTTLDFPGVVSALLFTQGCNFHCPYCHNAQLIPTEAPPTGVSTVQPVSEDEALSFLAKRADILDGVVITGGEPCLQQGIEAFCREAKKLGYKVKIDTNGSFPEVLRRLLEADFLDYAAVDVKTAPDSYAPLLAPNSTGASAGEKLAQTLALLAAHGVPHEARTTCVAPFVDEAAAIAMSGLVKPNVPWYFQRANIENPSAAMSALTDEEIRSLIEKLAATHPLARLRE